MFSILIYISLPLALLLHLAEEFIIRLRTRARDFKRFCAAAATALLITAAADICAIYGDNTLIPLVILTWGFCFHLTVHLAASIRSKSYRPGLVTAIVLLPYAGLAVADMLMQLTPMENLLYAVAGIIVLGLGTFLFRRTSGKQ